MNVVVKEPHPFDLLLDWATGIDRFLEAGDARRVCELAESQVKKRLKESRGADAAASNVKSLAQSLRRFAMVHQTCRGPEISSAAKTLKMEIEKDTGLPHAFRPLIEKVEKSVGCYCGRELEDGLAAACWCLDHNLVQQGYTILQESIVTHVALLAGKDAMELDIREVVSQAFSICAQKIQKEPDNWKGKACQDPALTAQICETIDLHPELLSAFEMVREDRNDLNHAGNRRNAKPGKDAHKFWLQLRKAIEKGEGHC